MVAPVLRDGACIEPRNEAERAARTDLQASRAVQTLTVIDESPRPDLVEADHLRLRTDGHAIAAVITATGIESDPEDREASEQRVEGTEGAEGSAPAAAQHEEVEEEDPRDREQAESGSEDQLAMEHGDRAQPLERRHPEQGGERDRHAHHPEADLPGHPELSVDPQALPQPAGQVRDHVERAHPGAEAPPAHQQVEEQDDQRPDQNRGGEHPSRRQDLQHREGIREGDGAQYPRAAQISRQPAEMLVSPEPEEHEEPDLTEAAKQQVLMSLQPGHRSSIPERSSNSSSTRLVLSLQAPGSGMLSEGWKSRLIADFSFQPNR